MIIKNKRSGEVLELSLSEFKTRFKNEPGLKREGSALSVLNKYIPPEAIE